MYKVLLVDDEPLILSGIKFLLDWEKNGCTVVDTARNGQQALDKIRLRVPDIVICDINMPVMSGIELLTLTAKEFPLTVFIMLTNHQEFDLAREALRLRAVDYLLKNQLDVESLEKSLNTAKEERRQRTRLAHAQVSGDGSSSANSALLIHDSLLRLIQEPPGSLSGDLSALLRQNGFTPSFAMLYLPVEFISPDKPGARDEDLQRLFAWQRDVVEKLAQNCFQSYLLLVPDHQCDSLILVCWEVDANNWREQLNSFCSRLANTSSNITQASIGVLVTELLNSVDQLEVCRCQLFELREQYYLTGCTRADYCSSSVTAYCTLGLNGIGTRLEHELAAKNGASCSTLLDKAIASVEQNNHHKSQAIWLCGECFGAVCAALGSEYFDREQGYREIEQLATRTQVVRWLQRLHNELAALLEHQGGKRNDLAQRARQYIQENICSRIMLQDVADYVCISSGYLSAIFKRVYNQNLVDYINQCKMEEACRLIREGELRIGEISYRLSFENAYYFTKVFKRHTGMTPSDYQRRCRGGS